MFMCSNDPRSYRTSFHLLFLLSRSTNAVICACFEYATTSVDGRRSEQHTWAKLRARAYSRTSRAYSSIRINTKFSVKLYMLSRACCAVVRTARRRTRACDEPAPTLEVYLASTPDYTGNITTPTLYDARSNTILSNDSFGIMRAFVQVRKHQVGPEVGPTSVPSLL